MLLRLAIPAALAMLMSPTGASAQFYGPGRWCAVVAKGEGHAVWDCSYASVEQCRPNVIAGDRGFCNLNPSFASSEPSYGPPFSIVVHRSWKHGRPIVVRRRVCG